LKKYHNIEKEIIESQIAVLKEFSSDNPRRQYIDGELTKDLEYVQSNMVDTPESMKRKEKMLQNHAEYLAVLQYHRDKLNLLPNDGLDKKYDSKFDHYKD